jgi:hypothetical protein
MRSKTLRWALAGVVAIATVSTLALGPGSPAAVGAQADEADRMDMANHDMSGMHNARHARRALHDGMRRLWIDHVTWTRLFIVSFVGDLPDLQATTNRLLRNQVDIGNAVKPFYGGAAGHHLTALLRQHILEAAGVLAAAKAGDTSAFNTAKRAWYRNARKIAGFLPAANPRNWPLMDLRHMMHRHLDLTLTEAADQLGGHYAKSVADFGRVEAEILGMADMLSSEIIAQFPNRFA